MSGTAALRLCEPPLPPLLEVGVSLGGRWFGKRAQLTRPLISCYELWRRRRRKRSIFFFSKNMVNDAFSEPPQRADSAAADCWCRCSLCCPVCCCSLWCRCCSLPSRSGGGGVSGRQQAAASCCWQQVLAVPVVALETTLGEEPSHRPVAANGCCGEARRNMAGHVAGAGPPQSMQIVPFEAGSRGLHGLANLFTRRQADSPSFRCFDSRLAAIIPLTLALKYVRKLDIARWL